MNAVKHGLDAQTLILPGEDPAAFQARLDAWKLDFPPRNPTEAALLEQAVRQSWQLDRAERVLTAHQADRLQQAQDDEAHRQAQAAAEAAEVGQRLVDGPPAPTFELNPTYSRIVGKLTHSAFFAPYLPADSPAFALAHAPTALEGKRLAMSPHPGDPNHPDRLRRRLESTAAGCQWLLDRWTELRTTLESGSGWRPEERLRAVRLLGKEPADAVDDPNVQAIYLCCFVLGEQDPHVLDDQAREMTDREFRYVLDRLVGRGVRDRVPPTRAAAQAGLLALVDGLIMGLEARAAAQASREAAAATARLAFDTSPEGERLRRLQHRMLSVLLRTVNRLMKVRRDLDEAAVPGRERRREIDARRDGSGTCETVRNEPNAPISGGRSGARGEETDRPAASDQSCVAQPAAVADRARNRDATPEASMSCETVRNEPNAGSRSAGRPSPSDVETEDQERSSPAGERHPEGLGADSRIPRRVEPARGSPWVSRPGRDRHFASDRCPGSH